MTSTLRVSCGARERATVPPPQHVGRLSRAIGDLMGYAPKTACRCGGVARNISDRIPEAARLAGEPALAEDFFAFADAQRAIDAAPLPLTADITMQVSRADRAEDASREAWLVTRTPETLRAFERALALEIRDKTELLCAIRATLEAIR